MSASTPETDGSAPTRTTLGARLEHQRLCARAARLDRVLEVLRRRAAAHDAGAVERAGLHRAIGEFEAELAEVTERLADVQRQDRDAASSVEPVHS
jgi:hypothetical protein